MKEIRTEIDIDATPSQVWSILTDLARYPEWNPLVPRAHGEVRVGARLKLRIDAGRTLRARPEVLVADPDRELRWRGIALHPKVFSGEHYFKIEAREGGFARLVHGEVFTGLVIPLVAKMLDRDALPAFERMNQALKQRAENKGKPA